MEKKKASPKMIVLRILVVIVILAVGYYAYGDEIKNLGYTPEIQVGDVKFKVGCEVEDMASQGVKGKSVDLLRNAMPAKSWDGNYINLETANYSDGNFYVYLYNNTNASQNLASCNVYKVAMSIEINNNEMCKCTIDGESYYGKNVEDVKEIMGNKGAKMTYDRYSADTATLWFEKGHYKFEFEFNKRIGSDEITVTRVSVEKKIPKDYKTVK